MVQRLEKKIFGLTVRTLDLLGTNQNLFGLAVYLPGVNVEIYGIWETTISTSSKKLFQISQPMFTLASQKL